MFRHFDSSDVNDDWIIGRTPFDLENFGDGLRVQCVGGEAIDRFGRQRDDFPGAEQVRRALDGGGEQLGCVRG